MPGRSWKFHLVRWLAIVVALVIVGWWSGYMLWLLAISLGTYSTWHIFNAWRMYSWLEEPTSEVPIGRGIWHEIFTAIASLHKQNQDTEDRHLSIIRDFQSLTDAFPDATLVLDESARITWFNNTAVDQLGLEMPGDIGQPVTNLLRNSVFQEWFQEPRESRLPLHLPSPQNENVWLEVTAITFRQNQSLVILRDITEFHNVEQIRRDFVANISHELRSPLTVILGYLELLQDHPEKSVSDAVARMLGQAAHIQALLDDLLELSRLQSDEVEGEEDVINVAGILMQIKEQAAELSQGNHHFHYDIDENLHLMGISADIESAFSNLIANAVKYTPEGGDIWVEWTESEDGPQFTVRDSGIGIPNRDIPRVTERFYRVGSDRARQSGGSGLGLAIVKHALGGHEANLIIDSELGEGSTFTCSFPAERRVRMINK